MSCCPEGSLPAAITQDSERSLSGVVEDKVYYVAPPSTSEAGVVVVYDIFGFTGGRIRSVCDAIASCGFHVAMPDIYDGTEMTQKGGFENPDAVAWLKAMTVWETQSKLIEPAFELLTKKGIKKFGAIGFCWGCYAVVKLSAEGKILAGVNCHPSLKVGKMFFDESEEDQIKTAKCPLAFFPAGNDPDHYRDGTLSDIVTAAGYDTLVIDFPDMAHGWVPRGDASKPEVARDVEKALVAATSFFKKHVA